MPDDPILQPHELERVAGGYKRPADQLRYLLERGFWRATRSPINGAVILERAHYEAVCRGAANDDSSGRRPKVRPRKARQQA